jgi:probable addiction module antidote protein
MNMIKLRPFDTARHLDNPEVISHYLAEAFQTRDSRLILRAIQNVVRAGNMTKVARTTGLSRTSLYWRDNTSPEFTTVLKVLAARGVRLRAEPDVARVPAGVLVRRQGEAGRRTAKKARASARKKK